MAEILREIAVAAGSRKLIAGQVADLEAEGKKVSRDELRYIHENKTCRDDYDLSSSRGDERERRSKKTTRAIRSSDIRSGWLFR